MYKNRNKRAPQSKTITDIIARDAASALGHKPTYAVQIMSNNDRKSGLSQRDVSALPPKADMCGAQAHVSFGPKADIRTSF
jgi:hypothetical protein